MYVLLYQCLQEYSESVLLHYKSAVADPASFNAALTVAPFECETCGEKFHGRVAHKLHLVTSHPLVAVDRFFSGPLNSFPCEVGCGAANKKLLTRQNFIHHLSNVHGIDMDGIKKLMEEVVNREETPSPPTRSAAASASEPRPRGQRGQGPCPVCNQKIPAGVALDSHMTSSHFYVAIDQITGGSDERTTCVLPPCRRKDYSSRKAFLQHLGRDHDLNKKYLKRLFEASKRLGFGLNEVRFPCVFRSCFLHMRTENNGHLMPFFGLLEHLATRHFQVL